MNAPEPFGPGYAEVYDLLNEDKDYASECDLIERLFVRESPTPVKEVLDLGCGTGRHAQLLAQRGYAVLGVDRSAPMIERARGRASKGVPTRGLAYQVGDLRTFRTDRRFDAALMMFAVLGYQLDDEDVLAALRTARVHLRDGGLLLFDCWYGPAVEHQRPSDRMKSVKGRAENVIRTAKSHLDLERRRITVEFDVQRRIRQVTRRLQETHELRFFFAADLAGFLAATGFSLQRLGVMPDFDSDPDETAWNVLALARASSPARVVPTSRRS